VYILLFNSYLKFHSKICTHCWNMNKSLNGLFFLTRLVHVQGYYRSEQSPLILPRLFLLDLVLG